MARYLSTVHAALGRGQPPRSRNAPLDEGNSREGSRWDVFIANMNEKPRAHFSNKSCKCLGAFLRFVVTRGDLIGPTGFVNKLEPSPLMIVVR